MRRLFAAIALVATLLMTTGVAAGAAPAHPRAHAVALIGEVRVLFAGPPARQWVADGVTHIRGQPLDGTFAFSGAGVALAGAAQRLDNVAFDAAGNGRLWNTVTYSDTATGVTCRGHSHGTLTQFLLTATVVARCSNGALLWGTLQDTEILVDATGGLLGVVSTFHGQLRTPGR